MPIFIVTDADPHGLSIALCYFRELAHRPIFWIGVCPSHLGVYFDVMKDALLPITDRERKLLDGIILEGSETQSDSDTHNRMRTLMFEALILRRTGLKFEAEALSALNRPGDVSELVTYLSTRIQEHAHVIQAMQNQVHL